MTDLKNYGRIFYGLGIVGIGILHFFFKGFRPIILPVPAASVAGISGIVYFIALYILGSGVLITLGKNVRNVSLILGVVFFAFLLFGHLPIRLKLGSPWIDAIKIFALSGGAFVVASLYPKSSSNQLLDKLHKIAPAGKYFFAIMLLLFGLAHFTSAQKISGLVPKYIPGAVFWTYVGAVALVGSGLSFIINFKVKWVGLLLGITLFLWLVMLHLYYAVRFPYFQDGENIIGSFECLAFCGTALLISKIPQKRKNSIDNNQLKRKGSITPAA
jgi:uncharacterized membrane protein